MRQDILNETLDEAATMTRAIGEAQKLLWTALPGIVHRYDPGKLVCDVQPAIKGRRLTEKGDVVVGDLPLLLDCPVVFPHAGGASLTFPIKPGDEVLVVFACRGIDLWWAYGGTQPPPEARMHDLSDGFCIPGVWSQPGRLKDVSGTEAELRTDDRKARISLDPASHRISIVTSGDVVQTVSGNVTQTVSGNVTEKVGGTKTVSASEVRFTCPVTMAKTLTVTGEISGAGITYSSHTHSGVESGHDNTGVPNR